MNEPSPPSYDVALSFAGEDRQTVEGIAQDLRGRGASVFYDAFEKTSLWGKDLQEHLTNVYLRWSRFVVIFISAPYREKLWTRHELRASLARAMSERAEYVLPVRFDDTVLDGLLPTIAYLDLRIETPNEICRRICEKLGPCPGANSNPSMTSRYRLRVLQTSTQVETSAPITKVRFTVGRALSCDLVLQDHAMSRTHFAVNWNNETQTHELVDFETCCGVTVNGVMVMHKMALRPGDHIRVGKTVMIFELE